MIVGICAIIKDCPEQNLKEWIEWHVALGVTYFFIFDNESKEPIETLLWEYPQVFIYQIKGKYQQLPAYNRCLEMHRKYNIPQCDWIAFIDDDEFINVESGSIKDLLSKQTSAGLGLNWVSFGTCTPEEEQLPQVQRYRKYLPLTNEMNTHIKSIVQPKKVQSFVNPHFCVYTNGGECLSITGEKVKQAWVKTPVMHTAWINHYYCKTEKEFALKVQKGRVDCPIPYSMQMFHDVNELAICTLK